MTEQHSPLPLTNARATTQRELYDTLGGSETFQLLTQTFYSEVRKNEILLPLYPESELEAAQRRLQLFLEQYWGGPTTYSQERGHPRLRMRHAPFTIGQSEKNAWLECMKIAVDSLTISDENKRVLWDYLTHAAEFLVNSSE